MERRKVIALVAAVGFLAVVVGGSVVSPSSLPAPSRAGSDKVQHAAAYFTLALVGLYAFDRDRWLVVALGVFALGAGVEVAQAPLPHRTASVADAAANGVGVAVALLGAHAAAALRDRKKE